VLALIIGINVIYVVNHKLSDVEINVPSCPAPNVIIHTDNNLRLKADLRPIDDDDNYDDNKVIEDFSHTLHDGYRNEKMKVNHLDNKANIYNTKLKMEKSNNKSCKNINYRFDIPKMYGNTGKIKGSNYSNQFYREHSDIDMIGSIPINNYDGEPHAYNF
tara:strand:- start:410 stop:889 length:480 start_codon:yes stop_codon:yes gene_type:complete